VQPPDLVNGLFELFGGLFSYANVYKLWKDKQIKGIYWFPTFFFAAWGLWNLYFYPHLNQWLSFTGGLVIVSANIAWITLVFYFRGHSK